MTIPTGSIVGVALLSMVVGIVIGRSARAMRGIGRLHAAAHGGSAASRAAAAGGNSDVRVQTVVVAAGDGREQPGAVEYARRVVEPGAVAVAAGSASGGELLGSHSDDLVGWGDWHEAAEVVS